MQHEDIIKQKDAEINEMKQKSAAQALEIQHLVIQAEGQSSRQLTMNQQFQKELKLQELLFQQKISESEKKIA